MNGLGLVLTVLGFGLTIWQMAQAKAAAEAAMDAANAAREEIASVLKLM